MKVVKDGKFDAKWNRIVLCKKQDEYDTMGCGAALEVEESDLLLLYWKGTHFFHYYPAIKCPRCGKYNHVKDVPQPVFEKLKEQMKESAIFDGFSALGSGLTIAGE